MMASFVNENELQNTLNFVLYVLVVCRMCTSKFVPHVQVFEKDNLILVQAPIV
jgi:hypothetical protein